MSVLELRVAVTAPDYEEALTFYRDVLGLREREAFASEDGRVTILEAGRATLELLDPTHDALELAEAGATVIAEPTLTPWKSMNARLEGPAGLQLTLFTEP